MTRFTMSIDGTQQSGASSFGVVNPATEEVFAEAPQCSRQQLDQAVAAAERAFKSWRSDEQARRAALLKASELIAGKAQELAQTLTLEQGKPLAQAANEALGAAAQLKHLAAMPLPHELLVDNEKGRI